MHDSNDRGIAVCEAQQEAIHLFGSYGTPPDFSGLTPATLRIPTSWRSGQQGGKRRLWLIQLSGRSIQREGQAALQPLSDDALDRDEGSFCYRPMAKASIVTGFRASTAPTQIDGDGSILIYSDFVQVELLVPAGVQDLAQLRSPNPTVPAGELAVDDRVSCTILGVQGWSQAEAAFTQTLDVPANTAASIPVPRGAFEVLVRPSGTDPGIWQWTIGDDQQASVSQSFTLGTFTPDSNPIRVPLCSHLQVQADANPRGYLLTWKVRR